MCKNISFDGNFGEEHKAPLKKILYCNTNYLSVLKLNSLVIKDVQP